MAKILKRIKEFKMTIVDEESVVLEELTIRIYPSEMVDSQEFMDDDADILLTQKELFNKRISQDFAAQAFLDVIRFELRDYETN